MGPDWKSFVEGLIRDIEDGKASWGKVELVRWIKDREIEFLEKVLHCMDRDEGE